MPTQLEVAQGATLMLVEDFHKEHVGDRCCIATFGSHYSLIQPFTTSKIHLQGSLARLTPDGGTTRFRDSICDFVGYFRTNAHPNRPWLIIVITDGDDNQSQRAPSQAGAHIRSFYNTKETNFMFTIGIGDGVNQAALRNLAAHGGYNHFGLESFALLAALFQVIAVQVVQTITGGRLRVGAQDLTFFDATKTVARMGIDYGFLIDISGSMSTQVSLPGRAPPQRQIAPQGHSDDCQPKCDCTILQQARPPKRLAPAYVSATPGRLPRNLVQPLDNNIKMFGVFGCLDAL